MLLVGVGLNSSGDPGRDSSCWELVLWRLLVGLGRGEVVGPGGVTGRGMQWAWGRGGATFPAPPPVFVLRFAFSIIHGSRRARKTGKAWSHSSRD